MKKFLFLILIVCCTFFSACSDENLLFDLWEIEYETVLKDGEQVKEEYPVTISDTDIDEDNSFDTYENHRYLEITENRVRQYYRDEIVKDKYSKKWTNRVYYFSEYDMKFDEAHNILVLIDSQNSSEKYDYEIKSGCLFLYNQKVEGLNLKFRRANSKSIENAENRSK